MIISAQTWYGNLLALGKFKEIEDIWGIDRRGFPPKQAEVLAYGPMRPHA